MRTTPLLLGAAAIAALALLPAAAAAQEAAPRPAPRVFRILSGGDANRTVIGVATRSTGARDTLGLLIDAITPHGPADKAGLQEGDRIASVNGVNLKLAPADAGQPDMSGLTTRRLVRELQKVKPGDEATFDVYANGGYRTVKLKTASARDLEASPMRWVSRDSADQRAVLGIGLGGGGNARDTLGLLVVSVATNGPADKAGIVEGDRIAEIDGVDVRVPADDDQGGAMLSAKIHRLERAMAGKKPGDAVRLRVYSGGQVKDVTLTAEKAATVYPRQRYGNFDFDFGGDGGMILRMPVEAPMPPLPPMPAMPPMDVDVRVRDAMPMIRERVDEARRAAREAERAMRDQRIELLRERIGKMGERVRLMEPDGADAVRGGSLEFDTDGPGGFANLDGLRLTRVNPDLASYFGAGSEGGLLVLDAPAPWSALQPGDVILAVDGTPVRRDGRTRLSLDSERAHTFDVLRKGKRTTVKVAGR